MSPLDRIQPECDILVDLIAYDDRIELRNISGNKPDALGSLHSRLRKKGMHCYFSAMKEKTLVIQVAGYRRSVVVLAIKRYFMQQRLWVKIRYSKQVRHRNPVKVCHFKTFAYNYLLVL